MANAAPSGRILECGIYKSEFGYEARMGYGENLLASQYAMAWTADATDSLTAVSCYAKHWRGRSCSEPRLPVSV